MCVCVCRSACVACRSVCVPSEGDVAWRSLLSDPMSRPMLWCEGHCQETATRQHRYSCPQCSFSSVAQTHTYIDGDTQPNTSTLTVKWHTVVGKPPRVKAPGLCTPFKTNAIAYLLTVCLLGSNYTRLSLNEKVEAVEDCGLAGKAEPHKDFYFYFFFIAA